MFSKERYYPIHFTEHRLDLTEIEERYSRCTYKITVCLSSDASKPDFNSMLVETNDRDTRRVIIYHPDLNPPVEASDVTCFKDRCRLGEFVALLAMKYQYDLLHDIKSDAAGFLHTDDIRLLHRQESTNVTGSIYKGLYRFVAYAEGRETQEARLAKAMLFEPRQLWHLICWVGRVGGKVEDIDQLWWLNVQPEDVQFRNKEGVIVGTELHTCLNKVFSKQLPSEKNADRIISRLDGCYDSLASMPKVQRRPAATAPSSNVQDDTHHRSSPFMTLEQRLIPRPHGRWICEDDFKEGGSYYRRKCQDIIIESLKERRRFLIHGTPGTGKSMLALAIGYEFLQEGFSVYYHDISTVSDSSQWTDFIKSCDEKTLLILDNIHIKYEEINSVLFALARPRGVLLVTSRTSNPNSKRSKPEGSDCKISYWEVFDNEKESKELEVNSDTLQEIINRYSSSVSSDERIVGDSAALLNSCGTDLNILRFYIEVWRKGGFQGELADIKNTQVLQYVYEYYIELFPYPDVLLKISALTQFEIDVDSNWCKRDLTELEADGLVHLVRTTEIETGRYVSWLRVYHPTIAEYFLKAAAYKGQLRAMSVDEFALQCLEEYLSTSPFNFFGVFHVLEGLKHKRECYGRLINNSDLFQLAETIIQEESLDYIECNQLPILYYICGMNRTHAADRSQITDTLFIPLFKRVSGSGFGAIHSCSITLICILIDALQVDMNTINFKVLGKYAQEDIKSFEKISLFIRQLARTRIPVDKLLTFCSEIDFRTLGKKVQRNEAHWLDASIVVCAAVAAGLPKERILPFYDEIDFDNLGKEVWKINVDCIHVGWFVYLAQAVGVPNNKILALFEQIDFQALGRAVQECVPPQVSINLFIDAAVTAGVPNNKILALFEQIDFQALGTKVLSFYAPSPQEVSKFICLANNIGVPNEKLRAFRETIEYGYDSNYRHST